MTLNDHKEHMQYELERQDKEWKAMNRREHRRREEIKTVVIVFLTVTIILLLLWRTYP